MRDLSHVGVGVGVLLSCVLLVAGDNAAVRPRHDIASRLENHLRSFMTENVNYSKPNVSRRYESDSRFHPKGMGHLYNVTAYFMKLIQKKDPFPEDFLRVEDDQIRMAHLPTQWRTLLAHYGGVVAVVACAVVFIVVLPFAGLIFCCCRCSGRCGARSQPFDKCHDRCKRVFLGILLTGVTIVLLFGVVCSFVTNAFLNNAINDLANISKRELNDTGFFLDNTKLEVHNLLITNYDQLEAVLNKALNESGVIVSDQLSEMSRVTSLDSLTVVVSGLNEIEKDLRDIKDITGALKDGYDELNKELYHVREGLLKNLKDCSAAVACQTMMQNYNISHLATDSDFNDLPDLTEQLAEMNSFKDISAGVDRGRLEFDTVRQEIQSAVDINTKEISRSLRQAGNAIAKIDGSMVRMLDEVKRTVTGEAVMQRIDEADGYVKQYAPIRYYLYMGMNCFLLLILVCLTFGLFYGFCGRRPMEQYGDDCCNKATGAKCLMIAVWLAFVFGGLLMAFVVVFFMAGVVTERAVCEPLRSPTDSQLMALVDQMVKIDRLAAFPEGKAPDITVSQLIVSCHQNRSLYTVLALDNVFNITQVTDYEDTYHISAKLDDFKENIRFDKRIRLLDQKTREELDELANSNLNKIDFPKYTEVITRSVVSIDLMDLSRALNKTALEIQMNPNIQGDIPRYFREKSRQLERLQKTLVNTMQSQSRRLEVKANQLQQHLTFNNSSLNAAVATLLADVEGAQKYLDDSMSASVKEIAQKFVTEFLVHVNSYLSRVVNETQENMGRCGPISNIYNSTVVATCDNLLKPFNGFWLSYGWCLLLFIPMIFLCVTLASLYQKTEKYRKPNTHTTESEYLYDAYAGNGGDNIPLANAHDKKNHHRSYDSQPPSGYLGNYSRARYTDIAPKHWDYPAAVPPSGSPRYHSPPLATEYERPPPYYYPGPGEPTQR